jgi:hypothetical protein
MAEQQEVLFRNPSGSSHLPSWAILRDSVARTSSKALFILATTWKRSRIWLQRAMLQTPADHILDGIAHQIPGSVERLGGFLPGEFAGPASQKQHIGSGQLVLGIAPGNLLHHDAAVSAMDASHTVEKENQNSPERDELEAPLGELIVPGCGLVAPRADRRRTLPRSDLDFDAWLVGAAASVLVDQSPMAMAVV